MADAWESFTTKLLARAHSPTSARRIFAEKIQHKPLLLAPTQKEPSRKELDARERRRRRRDALAELKKKKKRRRDIDTPLSAREKRKAGVNLIRAEERKYELHQGMHRLWCAYMREILNVPYATAQADEAKDEDADTKLAKLRAFRVEPLAAGPKLASADYHGAMMRVVRSRCVGRVGAEGIVVKDTKFTFVLITKDDQVKIVPKEHTVFRIELPLVDDDEKMGLQNLTFELHGSQFCNRAPDRATKKIKTHIPTDL